VKCLSLWNPWAMLLVAGLKRVETRSWAMRHRGPLLIQASKTWNPDLATLCVDSSKPFRLAVESMGYPIAGTVAEAKRGWGLPFGAIVGCVRVTDCFRTGVVSVAASNPAVPYVTTWANTGGVDNRSLRISEQEQAFGDYSPGRFAFLCESPVRFDRPIPYRGAQGLFEVPDEVIRGLVVLNEMQTSEGR